MTHLSILKRGGLLLIGLLLLSGCITTSMKGTPFYTGEYEDRNGADVDRVNLWPLLYYRDPALSILWPIMEFSPSHLALRPLYSVYDKNNSNAVYNVVWPLARFAPTEESYRIFPVYWGDEYFNILPLYWHHGDPFKNVGGNTLFPLWIWDNAKKGYGLDLFWPIYARHQYPGRKMWRVWPLYGTEWTKYGTSHFALWPLIQNKKKTDGTGFSVAFPFYYKEKSDEGSIIITPLYARKLQPDGTPAWKCYIPIVYLDQTKDAHFMTVLGGRWKMDDKSRWLALPILSGGRSDSHSGHSLWLAGLAKNEWNNARKSNYIFPFYAWDQDHYFYTALWGHNHDAIYYASPLIGRFRNTKSGSWFFPLYRHERTAGDKIDGSYLLLGHYHKSKTGHGHRFFPLFNYNQQKYNNRQQRFSYDLPDKMNYETTNLNYLLLGWNKTTKYYDPDIPEKAPVILQQKKGFFPLWNMQNTINLTTQTQNKKSSWLLVLYDTLSEKTTTDEPRNYLRRRILWHLIHYEKINGDSSTDIFPGITIDSHKNGYYQCSILWRLFRYENNPETQHKKLDLLFIPIHR